VQPPQPPRYIPPPPRFRPQLPQPYGVAPTSGAATASLILGIVGLIFGWCTFGVPCLLAVILGHVGYAQTKHGAASGSGMAVAGLILGYVMLVPGIVLAIFVTVGGALST
jgi:uncharacterized membrane protein